MFTKTTKIFAVLAMATGVLFLSSCLCKDDTAPKKVKALSITGPAGSDPEVRKEIEFMRSEKIITEDTYQKAAISKIPCPM